ncbi:MAG: diguanylate cyclase domain-containing protein [Spirochaetales bacterium]
MRLVLPPARLYAPVLRAKQRPKRREVELWEKPAGVSWDIREECAAQHHADIDGPVTISVGAASHPGANHVGDLIARADAALYRAKAGGRNRVERSDRL